MPNIEFGGRGQTSLSHCFSETALLSHDPESNQPPFVHEEARSMRMMFRPLKPSQNKDSIVLGKTGWVFVEDVGRRSEDVSYDLVFVEDVVFD